MSDVKRKLRITLALDPSGAWNSAGWGFEDGEQESDSILTASALEPLGDGTVVRIVEVDVEFPASDIIQGVLKNE